MDINLVRETVTVLSFIIFMGILLWAYGKGSQRGFEEAARIPFEEPDEFGEPARGDK
jgi:cytochrome c oxidase cbb3-type subunit 4